MLKEELNKSLQDMDTREGGARWQTVDISKAQQ
jgi:hypothetical protein